MYLLTIPPSEVYDATNNLFISSTKPQLLQLEHSLVSLSKWESRWCVPFITNTNKTYAESIDYIRCMTVTPNVDPTVYVFVNQTHIAEVNAYIELPMTATKFPKTANRPSLEPITAEIIYYWMITQNIPMECQKWHLNRLLALIKVINIKSQPPTKMSLPELIARNKALNDSRKAALNTSG